MVLRDTLHIYMASGGFSPGTMFGSDVISLLLGASVKFKKNCGLLQPATIDIFTVLTFLVTMWITFLLQDYTLTQHAYKSSAIK